MVKATRQDKDIVIQLLTASFAENQSVNYMLKNRHTKTLDQLMCYSFEQCYDFGEIFLNDKRNACALVLYPDKKKTTFKSIHRDLLLITKAIGWLNLAKALRREQTLRKIHPPKPLIYLWYIGVSPQNQHQGIGTDLLHQLKQYAANANRILCLETSTPKNVPWYEKQGFHTYETLKYGFPLYCMKI